MKISGVVIACNEEAKIGACIKSLQQVADQVIVLDSGSIDRTVALAQTLGAEVHYQSFRGHIEQKNAAVALAKHDWILSLDADEVLSHELIASVRGLHDPLPSTAYRMNRLNNFCGQWIRHGAWYPDAKIRLWHRAYGSWGGTNPHDKVLVRPGVVIVGLRGNILHYSYENLDELRIQSDKFAAIARQEISKSPASIGRFPMLRAGFKFFRDFVLKLGVLDGKAGLLIAYHNARYTYLKYSKIS